MGSCCRKRDGSYSNNKILQESILSTNSSASTKDSNMNVTLKDFEQLKLLGKGGFGTVKLVRLKATGKLYAMKILNKKMLKQNNQVDHTKTERDIMIQAANPFIVKIHFAFQDATNLYIVSEFLQGGDMFFHIHSDKKFSEEKAKFYLAQLVVALDFLHRNKMIYRDLKPENILLDSTGYIKLTDFGLSKVLKKYEMAKTVCGTPQYLAPEILTKNYDYCVDWFSLGCVMYVMLTGKCCIRIPRGMRLQEDFYQNIQIPNFLSLPAIGLLKGLLEYYPDKRLGHKNAEEIKGHCFFEGIDWKKLIEKKIKPPFIPQFKAIDDLCFFDKSFTEAEPDTGLNKNTTFLKDYSVVNGFTFIAPSVALEIKDAKSKNNKDDDL